MSGAGQRWARLPGAAFAIALGALSSGSAAAAPAAEPALAPCELLADAEVGAVQGQTPTARVPSEQTAGSFRFAQCFYRTAEFVRSVNLAVGVPLGSDATRSGPRDYWRQRFHPQPPPAGAPAKRKKEPPQPVAGVGDEAYWVGNATSGALYVLEGELFLRLSVGGTVRQDERRERAKALAAHGLERLAALRSAADDSPGSTSAGEGETTLH